MTEDHMLTGQLKPAYNVPPPTNVQYIASYSVHQNTTDTYTLIAHLEQHKEQLDSLPDNSILDSG